MAPAHISDVGKNYIATADKEDVGKNMWLQLIVRT